MYPIARGRCLDNGDWILHEIEFESKYVKRLNTSGFPDEPHTILNLHYSDYKPYEVQTNIGFSPKECYYKIIKKEQQVETTKEKDLFKTFEWIEI